MWSLAVLALAAEPPTRDALLALPSVHCRASGGLQWSRTTPERWVLAVGQQVAATGPPDALDVRREVVGPPTRVDRPGAPWQWSERIRVHRRDGGPVATIPDLPAVDATFRCTDRTDPDSLWVDVEQWWDGGVPQPGVSRCGAEDADVAWISTRRFAGVRPQPGEVILSTVLVVDHLAVGGQQMRADEPGTTAGQGGVEVVAETLSSTPLPSKKPNLIRTRNTVRFTRVDEAPLLPGQPSLQATLLCESYSYPPPP